MAIRVLIVDDHAVVREGLRMFLRADHDLEVVGEAANGAEALRLACELHPDVVLMDLLMPGMDGVAATAAIRRAMPEIEVVALTIAVEHAWVMRAMQAGAIGYLLKDTDAVDLRRAIRAAAMHQSSLSAQAATRLVREIGEPEPSPALTPRETAVLDLLAQGNSNKQIAQQLHISEETVKTHVRNVLAKLNVPSRTQAALYAVRSGLIPAA
jgi:two-component system, NarL family, response regulator LiaR